MDTFKDAILLGFQNSDASIKKSVDFALRAEAMEQLKEMTAPTTKDEEWKYTSLKKVYQTNWSIATSSLNLSIEDVQEYVPFAKNSTLLVFLNGRFQKDLSQTIDTEGVCVDAISNIQESYESALLDVSATQLNAKRYFNLVNACLATDGAFISIDRNKTIEQPIVILNLIDNNAQEQAVFTKNIIIAADNAQAKVLELTQSLNDEKSSFHNVYTYASVAKDARIEHAKLQINNENAHAVEQSFVRQSTNSNYTNHTYSLNGGIIRNNLDIALEAEHCEAYMNGLYLLDGKTHVDNHTLVDHQMPNAYSNEKYKGVLNGHSQAVFNGKIYVQKDAQKTNAFQENKNILLSDHAGIDTKPQLEIWADDVSCSHGATVGELDEGPLFYLRSRGISEQKAKAMLLLGFVGELLESITVPEWAEAISEAVEDQLAAI